MNKPSSNDSSPPKWIERLLIFLLKKRDRATVSGDLLEEYREVILPERGHRRANLWYLGQVLGFVDNFKFGLILGFVLAGFNLLSTLLAPFAEDTPFRVGTFFSAVMLLWGASGFAAERRTDRVAEAIKAGAIVGAISVGLFHLAVILRVNLFFDTVSQRADWQGGLLIKFNQSGFESLRAYANYTYLQATGVVLPAGALLGAMCGTVGGLIGAKTRLWRRPLSEDMA